MKNSNSGCRAFRNFWTVDALCVAAAGHLYEIPLEIGMKTKVDSCNDVNPIESFQSMPETICVVRNDCDIVSIWCLEIWYDDTIIFHFSAAKLHFIVMRVYQLNNFTCSL